jgi:hypothetical protein
VLLNEFLLAKIAVAVLPDQSRLPAIELKINPVSVVSVSEAKFHIPFFGFTVIILGIVIEVLRNSELLSAFVDQPFNAGRVAIISFHQCSLLFVQVFDWQ